jgi:hypothetical protein
MKKNFIIRKNWVDENSELARCSELDIAVKICKPGYTVYNEAGEVVFTLPAETKYGDRWVELKSKIENDVLDFGSRRSLFIGRKELYAILRSLVDIIKMMNELEDEEI